MNSLKIFLKSNDVLANSRLIVLAMLVSPALQVLFITGLAFTGAQNRLPANLLFVAATTVIGFSVTLFANSVFTDRINLVYSTQLVGRNLVGFFVKRCLYVWFFTLLMATVMLILLQIVELVVGGVGGSVFSVHEVSVYSFSQKILLLTVISFTSTGLGFLCAIGSLWFSDPFKIVNLVLPFIPVLMPVLTVRSHLPGVLYYLSWLLPGGWLMDRLQVGGGVSGALFADIGLTIVFMAVSLLLLRSYLHFLAETGQSEQPF